MTRPRRNRLADLGRSAPRRKRNGARETRCRDEGFGIAVRGVAPIGRALAFAAPRRDEEWGWPSAEPSMLAWSDPDDGDGRIDRIMAWSAALEVAPPPSPEYAPAMAPPPALADDEADAEVRAILAEKGLIPVEPPAPAPPAPAPEAAAPPPPPEAESPVPPVDRHAVFAAMGRPMAHANSFSLGRFDLDRHFSMLEEGLSLDPPGPPPAGRLRADPRQLDDTDVIGELALISESAGVAPPAAAADGGNFLQRAAEAQSVRLADLQAAHAAEQEEEEEEEPEPEPDEEEPTGMAELDALEQDEEQDDE